MGHIGVKGLRSAVEGIPFDDSTSKSCAICAKANIKHTPFPQKASHRATQLLERIHCDICRPLPSSYGSHRYFILFICCYSRFIFVSLLKSRDEAYQCFVEFRSIAQTFSCQSIKILRVDNAPELIKGKLETYCRSAGISYEKTVPDSPSQNGVAEQSNLTLVSMARAMLIDANLSNWFWPFAIQTAVHIKNRVPHSSLPPHTTPFEFWYHYKPNLSYMRPFGAYCTSRILITPDSKFDPRGESARFLGYAKDAKGYILWVPGLNGRAGSVKTRHDVSFHGFPSSTGGTAPPFLWDDISASEADKHSLTGINGQSPSRETVTVPGDVAGRNDTTVPNCVNDRSSQGNDQNIIAVPAQVT
jgi:hypothetical protein